MNVGAVPLSWRLINLASNFTFPELAAIGVRVRADTFYPINTVQCCTPALLLDSGDAWELERCGCHDSRDPDFPVNCGGTTTDELLLGYVFFRLAGTGRGAAARDWGQGRWFGDSLAGRGGHGSGLVGVPMDCSAIQRTADTPHHTTGQLALRLRAACHLVRAGCRRWGMWCRWGPPSAARRAYPALCTP